MNSTSELPVADRRVDLDGALNFRDLGGYAATTGTTRRGLLYRSDALSTLSARDVSRLLDLGLATVVDLRNARELDTSPGVFAAHTQVQYHHNPVAILDDADLPPHERLLAIDFAVHNVDMARRSGETFAFLFHLLAREEAYPLVFHCAGGRDRTGVAAALILSAAGVSRETIFADYLISNEYLVPLMQRLRDGFAAQGIDPEPILANLHLRETYLAALFDMLNDEFAGIDGYVASIGIHSDELARFRTLFVAN
ncbi:MAG TPA: tyrosine-protein phosphatase [Chloroflexota bacterium]|jgi:protein-tyrosine phosphatase